MKMEPADNWERAPQTSATSVFNGTNLAGVEDDHDEIEIVYEKICHPDGNLEADLSVNTVDPRNAPIPIPVPEATGSEEVVMTQQIGTVTSSGQGPTDNDQTDFPRLTSSGTSLQQTGIAFTLPHVPCTVR